jgi:hypothetical protein
MKTKYLILPLLMMLTVTGYAGTQALTLDSSNNVLNASNIVMRFSGTTLRGIADLQDGTGTSILLKTNGLVQYSPNPNQLVFPGTAGGSAAIFLRQVWQIAAVNLYTNAVNPGDYLTNNGTMWLASLNTSFPAYTNTGNSVLLPWTTVGVSQYSETVSPNFPTNLIVGTFVGDGTSVSNINALTWNGMTTNIFNSFLLASTWSGSWGAIGTNALSQFLLTSTYNAGWGSLGTNALSSAFVKSISSSSTNVVFTRATNVDGSYSYTVTTTSGLNGANGVNGTNGIITSSTLQVTSTTSNGVPIFTIDQTNVAALWLTGNGLIYPSGVTGTGNGWIGNGNLLYPQ